eukprot:TRINITY_DN24325_c0_g1_i1.p1 TRINITY_DN24325_c0_g1~~TRINITY_DN24325_c0_g1_i1.p1  ORF type:complete len:313 (+),score=34.34 TRINITY_DN24325_c0_g1_i1:56-940(+)
MAKAAQCPSDPLWLPEWIESEGEKTIVARSQEKSVKLYCSWFCPFAQRVWIALEEKGVDYQYVEINPYEVDENQPGGYTKKQLPLDVKKAMYPDFIRCSPKGLVPAMDTEGEVVWESLPMIEYVDEKFAGSSYMPETAHKRALVRIWSDFCTSKMQKSFYTLLMEQDISRQGVAREQFLVECRTFANAMEDSGPFFLGDKFSMVDIALAPFWLRFMWIGGYYRDLVLPNDEPAFVRLNRWWEAVKERPSVARTIVCQPRLVSSYSQYSRNQATSDVAKSLQSSLSDVARARQST